MFIPKEQLRQILVGENLITSEQLDAYALEAERKNQNLIELLISERVADANYFNTVVARVFGVELANLANVMQIASLCGLGQSAPNPVLSTLRYFPEEYEALLQDGERPAESGNGKRPAADTELVST